jgi:hypothetical protein
MGITRTCDEDLGRTYASEEGTNPVHELALVIAQFTVGETEFETIRPRNRQYIEGPVPFTVTDLDDVAGCRARYRREPTTAPVRGHSHCHRDPAVRLLDHEETTPDGFVVLVRRQHQRLSWEKGTGVGAPRDGLHPPPHCSDRRAG